MNIKLIDAAFLLAQQLEILLAENINDDWIERYRQFLCDFYSKDEITDDDLTDLLLAVQLCFARYVNKFDVELNKHKFN